MSTGVCFYLSMSARVSFKLSKKTEKLLNEQLTLVITRCTLTGLLQQAKKSHWK